MLPYASLSVTISQRFARIGLDIQKGQLEIRQPAPELQISQPPARMEIDQGPGQLHIDGEDARSALGHKPTARMLADIAAQARQIALNAVGDIAAEGDQLMRIEHGTTIADIITQRMNRGPMPIEDTGPFTYNPVKVSYEPHPTTIEWTLGDVEITPTLRAPEITYTPGAVRPYLEQKNWLQIGLKGKYLNMEF